MSAHYIRDPRLSEAIGRFLSAEEEQVADVISQLGAYAPGGGPEGNQSYGS